MKLLTQDNKIKELNSTIVNKLFYDKVKKYLKSHGKKLADSG